MPLPPQMSTSWPSYVQYSLRLNLELDVRLGPSWVHDAFAHASMHLEERRSGFVISSAW